MMSPSKAAISAKRAGSRETGSSMGGSSGDSASAGSAGSAGCSFGRAPREDAKAGDDGVRAFLRNTSGLPSLSSRSATRGPSAGERSRPWKKNAPSPSPQRIIAATASRTGKPDHRPGQRLGETLRGGLRPSWTQERKSSGTGTSGTLRRIATVLRYNSRERWQRSQLRTCPRSSRASEGGASLSGGSPRSSSSPRRSSTLWQLGWLASVVMVFVPQRPP